jgi:hypothetical protein
MERESERLADWKVSSRERMLESVPFDMPIGRRKNTGENS